MPYSFPLHRLQGAPSPAPLLSRREYGLPLSARYFAAVRDGTKIGTIRRGELDIPEGATCMLNAQNQRVEVLVQKVRHKKFSELGPEDARLENAKIPPSVEAVKQALRGHYPDITDDDSLTVIEFSYVRDMAPASARSRRS